MPNQRSKNKVYLGGFVEKELHQAIVRLARKNGMEKNKFGFVAQVLRKSIGGQLPKAKLAGAKRTPRKVSKK